MSLNKLKYDLKWRGLLKDIVNESSLEKILNENGNFYIGIDPTSDSIHLGHFLSLSLSKILFDNGLNPIIVLGGFTGMIGDPSGKNSEREIIDKKIIDKNVSKITKQIKQIFKKIGIDKFEIINNKDFYNELNIIDFYQKYGKLFNINNMLNKESVKNRLENGISYTEFSYQIFQAIDFLKLFEEKNVRLQIGGSDQWGNIVSGTELIKKIHGHDVTISGITINLLTDENGNKIGKTNGNPIWLDIEKTSSYILFQYFINLSDDTCKKLLCQITNLSEDEYIKIINLHEENPKLKILQNKLSKIFISKIYSDKEYENAKNLSELLFKENYNNINLEQINLLKNLPSIKNENIFLMDLLIQNSKVKSRREYREFLLSNSIKINGKIIKDENHKLKDEFILNKLVFISVGKKNKYIIWK